MPPSPSGSRSQPATTAATASTSTRIGRSSAFQCGCRCSTTCSSSVSTSSGNATGTSSQNIGRADRNRSAPRRDRPRGGAVQPARADVETGPVLQRRCRTSPAASRRSPAAVVDQQLAVGVHAGGVPGQRRRRRAAAPAPAGRPWRSRPGRRRAARWPPRRRRRRATGRTSRRATRSSARSSGSRSVAAAPASCSEVAGRPVGFSGSSSARSVTLSPMPSTIAGGCVRGRPGTASARMPAHFALVDQQVVGPLQAGVQLGQPGHRLHQRHAGEQRQPAVPGRGRRRPAALGDGLAGPEQDAGRDAGPRRRLPDPAAPAPAGGLPLGDHDQALRLAGPRGVGHVGVGRAGLGDAAPAGATGPCGATSARRSRAADSGGRSRSVYGEPGIPPAYGPDPRPGRSRRRSC